MASPKAHDFGTKSSVLYFSWEVGELLAVGYVSLCEVVAMSYGIIRIQKFTSGSVRGIDIHDNRKKEFSHTNQDIDFSQSENNYNFKQISDSFYNLVQSRIKELNLPKAVRKDAIVMSQALITSDKYFFDGLSNKQHHDFFKCAYEFIENRYGKENIISATVHLDEKTPHMHVNFVPVTSDGRLCAKDLLNKKEFQSLQNSAYTEVFKSFGLKRGEIREDKRKHLTTEELKIKTSSKRLDEIKTELKQNRKASDNASRNVENARRKLDLINCDLLPLQVEYNAKKAYIRKCDKLSEVSMMYPEYSKITKKMFSKQEYVTVPAEKWEAKHVSANKIDALEKQQEELERGIEFFKNSNSSKTILKKFKEYERKIEELLEENSSLKNGLETLNNSIERINKVFKLNAALKTEFFETEREIKYMEEQEQERQKQEKQSRRNSYGLSM